MDQPSGPNEKPFGEAEERVIRGAEAIAEFISGDRSHRRKVYYLAECSKIPIHRLGSTLCLRPAGLQKLDRKSGKSRRHECKPQRVESTGGRAGGARLFPSLNQRH